MLYFLDLIFYNRVMNEMKDFASVKPHLLLVEQYIPEFWRKSYGTLRSYIEIHRLKRHWTSRRARGTGSALVVESAASRYTRCIRSSLSSSSSRTRTQPDVQRILAVYAHKRRRVYDTATANGARGPWPKFFPSKGAKCRRKEHSAR